MRARLWHPTQDLEDLPDGRVRFTFSCVHFAPVVSWVLEWGPHARVVEPAELRDAVIDEFARARSQYPD